MYLQRTLEDWARFDINKRTKHDASISSGLALMACNKNKYRPVQNRISQKMRLEFKKYDNKGLTSKIIE
jgi:ribosomal protein L33